jgi:hypothetical protein
MSRCACLQHIVSGRRRSRIVRGNRDLHRAQRFNNARLRVGDGAGHNSEPQPGREVDFCTKMGALQFL